MAAQYGAVVRLITTQDGRVLQSTEYVLAGTSGYVLTSAGPGTPPTWSVPVGGGGPAGFPYAWVASSSTPGTGLVSYNAGTTTLYVNDHDNYSADLTGPLGALAVVGSLLVWRKETDPTTFGAGVITAVSHSGGVYTFALTGTAGGGGFTGGDALDLLVIPVGPTGATGATGSPGSTGAPGADGPGVPAGGTTRQYLRKVSDDDFDTAWVDLIAADVAYSAGTPGNWAGSPPTTVSAALDRLAAAFLIPP